MKIQSTKYSYSNYSNSVNFRGHKFTRFVAAMSSRYSAEKLNKRELKILQDTYNNLWKKLSLPENLKPELQTKRMLSMMGFSVEDYAIYVDTSLSPFKMNVRNKTGYNKSLLRHEIEHVRQIWEIIKLVGANNFAKEINNKNINLISKIKPESLKKIREVEQTFGRILPNSEEGKIAQSYLKALREYPDVDRAMDPVIETIYHIKYINNALEKGANLVAKEYKPSFLKKIKITIREFINLLAK